jgi:hypothetical protein
MEYSILKADRGELKELDQAIIPKKIQKIDRGDWTSLNLPLTRLLSIWPSADSVGSVEIVAKNPRITYLKPS